MNIGEMFAKPIDREMKGVIKVGQDDNANIKQELEEYVVTRELQKHFRDFLIVINVVLPETQIRWVSGFPVSLEVVNPTS